MAVASDYGIEVGQVLTPPPGESWTPREVEAISPDGQLLILRFAGSCGMGHSYLVDDFAKDAGLKRVAQ
ncbi:hypothetical protein RCCRONUS_38 [Rhodobacter phage RcCronus]|mgnify:CR=1 FL=1|uniref:Uncharacterized protein n=3 Tax=Cronusvirus cronus TaxID=2005060 RepID=A0A0K1LM25_9CAUD|nr:hypothetical protein RCRHEA_39 [Rhodobacter phage RcRhea]YP_009616328.1 hypothetical protein FDI78_gp38 [Rhodobacter phage RcCronus]AKU43283.1 hypothetical protein RCRHEA_39 [Rhodobacter phage RcRhea]AKU43327.1 hypothetical protein RCCRONUS_38 [Rhodobacter phage RcCronus]AKY02707.1 hypothetical protein RCSAXON_40 [Rhodobacter phage RcSaxon]